MISGLAFKKIILDGKFVFTSNKEKVDNDIDLLFSFAGNRVYLPDYGADFSTLLQRTSAYFFQYRPLLLGQLRQKMEKQLPAEVYVDNLVGKYYREDKAIAIDIFYGTTDESIEQTKTVVFL